MRGSLTWSNLLIVIASISMLVVSGSQAWRTSQFLHRAERTKGLIVDASSHPRIRFTTVDGRAIEFVQNGFLTRPLNADVSVAYLLANPEQSATAAYFWPLWGSAVWPLVPGLGLLTLALTGAIFGASGRWN